VTDKLSWWQTTDADDLLLEGTMFGCLGLALVGGGTLIYGVLQLVRKVFG
jgi:uncharacterized membrane protein (DUF2068 family)